MRAPALVFLIFLPLNAGAAEVVRVPPFEFHNSFWMSLHQMLIAELHAPHELDGLSAEDQGKWKAAVDEYRAAAGRNPIFADKIVITDDALTQVTDDATEPLIDAPLAQTLLRVAPIYRANWWAEHERANRFFIAYAAPMLREAAGDLVREHEKVYGAKWPERIRVYVTPYAEPFGAYTHRGRAGGAITIMSSRDAGYQGLRAVEMVLHESSHTIIGPNNGPVARAIAAAAKKHDVEAPGDLWHAILFSTSSELAKRWLNARGQEFTPSSADMFSRVWPKYRDAVEKYWVPYVLTGQGTLEEAVDRIIAALPR